MRRNHLHVLRSAAKELAGTTRITLTSFTVQAVV